MGLNSFRWLESMIMTGSMVADKHLAGAYILQHNQEEERGRFRTA